MSASPVRADAVTAARHFELRHCNEPEPWLFADRAAEILRHEWIVGTAVAFGPDATLDVGCTAGQLTGRLAGALPNVTAVDVSPTAVISARQRIGGQSPSVAFLSGSVLSLPVADASFDLIVAADGLYSWDLPKPDRVRALEELHRALRPGGHVIFTDHMRPARFVEFIEEIEHSPFAVRTTGYLYDRLWYQFESWLRAVQHFTVTRWIRRNLVIARMLAAVGRRLGSNASRHICIVGEKCAPVMRQEPSRRDR